jgi:hypothetical protein
MACCNTNFDGLVSLDDYIKHTKAKSQLCMQNIKKKFIDVDKDELDKELDEIAQNRAKKVCNGESSSKFDRYRDEKDSSEDEAMEENPSIQFAKHVAQLDCPDCDKLIKPFTTTEQKFNVSIISPKTLILKEFLMAYFLIFYKRSKFHRFSIDSATTKRQFERRLTIAIKIKMATILAHLSKKEISRSNIQARMIIVLLES